MLACLSHLGAAQCCAAWPRSRTPLIFIPPRGHGQHRVVDARRAGEGEDGEVALAALPFSICFTISSSGVWSGANSTRTGTPARS